MSDFDPGEGWRRWDYSPEDPREYIAHVVNGGVPTYWVREEPMPPLPTEPNTVIRVGWRHPRQSPEMDTDLRLSRTDRWVDEAGLWLYPWQLAEDISGFEVLAEPKSEYDTDKQVFERRVRRETAKAVLDWIDWKVGWPVGVVLQARKEFGLDS